jgi:hypothetical protein
MPGHQDVVEGAHAAEELHVLERPRDAEPGDLIRPEMSDVALAEMDRTAGRAVKARMQLKMVVLPAPLGPINPWMRPGRR